MFDITLKVDDSDKYLDLNIVPNFDENIVEAQIIFDFIKESEFSNFFIFDENVIDALSSYKSAIKNKKSDLIVHRIGERRDTQIKLRIVEDQLSAYLTVTSGYAGKLPTINSLKKELDLFNIKRGISQKRLNSLIERCSQTLPGEVFETLIAKGLPPRVGQSSKLKPLVKNALDRILKPQNVGTARVDMRNLGDIICVRKGTEILRRVPPTEGRNGYTVCGDIINSNLGKWVGFKPGDGTIISDADENLLLADISGMPKFKDQKMWVDDVFICKGVNVGSGNIDYDGSVIVNGDVTEKMEISASGDVTVNGFVESATIHAGGDIIITEGAMGKVNESGTEYSTCLTSKGSVHIQHGQGLDINCNGSVTVAKQLAYSRINCKGKVSIGDINHPNGNIFACTIKCHDKFTAGTVGAVSGSNLSVDFSDGFNIILERKETLDELLKQIKQNNSRHLERINTIKAMFIPKDMQIRIDDANKLLQNETQMLQWLESKSKSMQESKDQYQNDIQLISNKKVYPGVVVKLNNRTWRADREYDRVKICFQGHQWNLEPLI